MSIVIIFANQIKSIFTARRQALDEAHTVLPTRTTRQGQAIVPKRH